MLLPNSSLFLPPCSQHMLDDSGNMYLCLWVAAFVGEGDLRCAACPCCVPCCVYGYVKKAARYLDEISLHVDCYKPMIGRDLH